MSRRYSNNSRQHLELHGSDRQNTKKVFVPMNGSQVFSPSTTLSVSLCDATSSTSSSSQSLSNNMEETILNRAKNRFTGDGESVHDGRFVNYLPQDEAVAAGLGADEGGLDPENSQKVVDLLNRELLRLLRSSPRDFWREVARDTSLHDFLDNFLKYRSRWYDFPHHGIRGTVAGVIVGEHELIRRVFVVLYRISSNRDPNARSADALNPKDHEALLQRTKLLDLPKLLDICAIYGRENEKLTTSLVRNALNAQSISNENISSIGHHFLKIVHTMYHRSISSLEDLYLNGTHDVQKANLLCTDLLEMMNFVNDAMVSMDSFVTAYKPAAVFFSCPMETSHRNEELMTTLAHLHDTLLPSLDRGFRIILQGQNEGLISNISVSLKMLAIRLVEFGWKLLSICHLNQEEFQGPINVPTSSKMFPVTVEDPIIRAEILIQTLRDINDVLLYDQEQHHRISFLHTLDKQYNLSTRIQSLQNAGWIILDEEQINYLSRIMSSDSFIFDPKVEIDEDSAILDSKIVQIKDLFPDYGNGFLSACLEVYNQNPEEVIQRILEGTLHEDLNRLDISLEKLPKTSTNLNPLPSSRDKGKGKMVAEIHDPVGSSTSGRFVRKSTKISDQYVAIRNDKDVSLYEYEDEYDDSYDDLGLSITDSGFEDSEDVNRMNSAVGTTYSEAGDNSERKWGKKTTQFYVKDGKNYSYKVSGSVAVANTREASLVSQAQGEQIYGLGRGGNIPLGAAKKLMEYQEQNEADRSKRSGKSQVEVRGEKSDDSESESGNMDSSRGRGRRGRGRSRGSNQYRKDRAFKKHFAGVSGI